MKRKGRFSLVLALILLALGVAEITIGLLDYNGILQLAFLSKLLILLRDNFALTLAPSFVISPGILLLLISIIMLSFRNRKPFSHFYEIYIIFEYLTLEILLRTRRGEAMPPMLSSYLVKIEVQNKGMLLTLAFILEIVLGIFLLYIASFIDSSWRRKRDFKIKKLIHDGVIPSEEEEEAEKDRIHQEKLNAIEEKKMKRVEAKAQREREKAERAEAKRKEKEELRDRKEYEKSREREEIERERAEEKAKAKAESEEDKKREAQEVLSKKEAKRKAKEEKRNRKKEAKELKGKKSSEDEDLPPLELGFAANPNNPLEFPSFSEMPELKTIESYNDEEPLVDNTYEQYEEPQIEEDDRPEIESLNIKSIDSGSTHFKSGGMLEATLEAYNRNKKNAAPMPPQRPIIGFDGRRAKEEQHSSSSFAPSNLPPDHPRYKIFEELQHSNRKEIPPVEKEDEAKSNFAPSNLSPEHPRYKIFESLNCNNARVEPEVNEEEPTVKAPSNLSPDHPRYKMFEALSKEPDTTPKKEPKPSIAPSKLSPDHPRYKMFESLKRDDKTVSHFPGKAFEPEVDDGEIEILKSTYEKAPEKPVYTPTQMKPEVKPEPIYSEEPKQTPIYNEEPKASYEIKREAKPEPIYNEEPKASCEIKREEPKPEPQYPEPAGEEESEDSSEDAKQDRELELSVGIGGLTSNNMGFYAIKQRASQNYAYPPVNLLQDYPSIGSEIDSFTRERGNIIVDTLLEYKVSVELTGIIKGPTVTMYELKLGVGTFISRVTARENEINYALGGSRIRILAPIPGKQAVGIEVPNAKRETIGFKDMIYALRANEKYRKFKVPMILGKTITGDPVVIDVCKMPHMIIAGTTGSGKSVCINSFINTILYQKGPKEVRLLMVDPKTVELSMYNGIPHLLTPVITDAKRVVKVLNWLVEEMERRYQMISKFGVRNIEGLNDKLEREHIAAEKMPYIVLIMDEFADMMSVVGKDIENLVARLTAKARAAGIHLILATQRPSSDVITGTIKSNLPARVAFAVSSGINSRVILDQSGAETLLGKGDMLLLDPSARELQRIQGAFLSDDEVDAISSFARENAGESDYLSEDLFEDDDRSDDEESSDVILADDDSDEALYSQAKQICFERKCASASYLQRRMKIGYNRAARLIEMMEEDGIVGEAHGSKPREILRYE